MVGKKETFFARKRVTSGGKNMIESVKIIHDWKQIKEYRFWADFFCWTGTQVREYTLKNDDFSTNFSLIIIIEEEIDWGNLQHLREQYPGALFLCKDSDVHPGNSLEMKDAKERQCWNNYLAFYLDEIKRQNLILTADILTLNKEIEMLKKLGEIYVKHAISYHRNAYSCFYENENIVQKAQDAFVNAYVALRYIMRNEDNEETAATFYTEANLIRYMDETDKFLDQPFLIDIERGMEFLDGALALEPQLDNAYMLKGLLAELEDNYNHEGKVYYDLALERMKDKEYSSYPLYLQARYYEKKLKNDKKAIELYTQSFLKDPYEYRAIYKLAIYAKRNGEYIDAIERFKQICNILKDKEKSNYLQPREYEYLFKAYLELTKIYGNEGFDLSKYKEMVDKRDEFCGRVPGVDGSTNRAYEEIFGSQAANFRLETYHRFKTTVMICEQ
ncbi:tetratricopeptide repeat protein [Blautia glucerasea]|uniref:tetratricopeptide repeat protein n=1 Tax=Blautia glucerasea TaxID=536633 RepID=UPI001D077629|nr:hypothetical protein [Blautia glucerasea]MCB6545884.1 hypothetical protein [Blautia glucerasea]